MSFPKQWTNQKSPKAGQALQAFVYSSKLARKLFFCDSNIAEKALIVAVCDKKNSSDFFLYKRSLIFSIYSAVWLLSVISVITSCLKSTSQDPCILKPFLSVVSRVFRCKDVLCVNGPLGWSETGLTFLACFNHMKQHPKSHTSLLYSRRKTECEKSSMSKFTVFIKH